MIATKTKKQHFKFSAIIGQFGENRQSETDRQNNFIDSYNAKAESVLSDEILMSGFETILDEQKAVMIIDGNLSEAEAEQFVTNHENIRRIVLNL